MQEPDTPREGRRAIGRGSGFAFAARDGLLSDETYILADSHVAEDAEQIRVKFRDRRQLDAQVSGSHPRFDVAVVEIKTDSVILQVNPEAVKSAADVQRAIKLGAGVKCPAADAQRAYAALYRLSW